MRTKRSKVVIVGAGLVGSATAFSLITQAVCDDVVLIDKDPKRAKAEAMDLQNCIEYLNRNAKIEAGGFNSCSDADIVVITAAAPYAKGQTRLDMLEQSAGIVRSIVPAVMKSGFDGLFILITNPVDVISYYAYRLSGLPKGQIIGTGTALDSARLKNILADLIKVDPRSIHAFTMGEHGDSQMIPWSRIYIGGKPFFHILKDNRKIEEAISLVEVHRKTVNLGWEIAGGKGATNYGIAATTVGIIKAVLFDENRVIPVSALLTGEYGESNVFAGVPAIINRSGVKEIVEIPMTAEEKRAFQESVAVIRTTVTKLNCNG